jgi:hypothetical protein
VRLYISKSRSLANSFCSAYKSYQTVIKIADDGCVFEAKRWVRHDNSIEVDRWVSSPKVGDHNLLLSFGYTELKPVNKYLEDLKEYDALNKKQWGK